MANCDTAGTFTPMIPKNLFNSSDLSLLDAIGVTCDDNGDGTLFLYNERSATEGYLAGENGEETELEEEDVYSLLQEVIKRSKGTLPWIHHEQAYTCEKMRPGEFGGSAVFITANDIKFHGTSSWLADQIDGVTPKMKEVTITAALKAAWSFIENTREDDPERNEKFFSLREQVRKALSSNNTPSQVNLAIVLEGGLVSSVVSDHPEIFSGTTVSVIDYDTNDPDEGDTSLGCTIDGEDGSLQNAYIRRENISMAEIDMEAVSAFMAESSYGATQVCLAVCEQNPCVGCPDINSDGDRCVNDVKCLAWRRYTTND